MPSSPRFRFAPSPTNYLHLGSMWAALLSWSFARHEKGQFVLRIEDIDETRSKKDYESAILKDLDWLGLDWDEGPQIGGAFGPYRQSERTHLYDAALSKLSDMHLLYPCRCSRSDIRQAQTKREPKSHYPGSCEPSSLLPVRESMLLKGQGGYRLSLKAAGQSQIRFQDYFYGEIEEDLSLLFGDFLLGREGHPTYQLAVSVDDLAMGITHIVRGKDLLFATACQSLLHGLLAKERPNMSFAHHGLVLNRRGEKFSKSKGARPLSSWAKWASKERLIAALGRKSGVFHASIAHATAMDFKEALFENPMAIKASFHTRDFQALLENTRGPFPPPSKSQAPLGES